MTLPHGITASYDPAKMDPAMIVPFIQSSYWGAGRAEDDILRSFDGSHLAGLFDGDRQLAFARAISDTAFFAYICDLFVIPEARGRGLGRAISHAIMDHPKLSGVTGWMLATRDAHNLYKSMGYMPAPDGRYMCLTHKGPDV